MSAEVEQDMEEITQSGEQAKRKSWSRRKKVIVILSAVIALIPSYFLFPLLFVVFVAQPVRVEGAAMSPTLNNGDKIFVGKKLVHLERGDIVVFYYPKDTTRSFIKRIIGLPGEKIDIDADGSITINGQALPESYIHPERNQMAKARWDNLPSEWKQLADDTYFLMGDNRDASNDSRIFGPVAKKLIYGKYLMRYWVSSE